MGLFIILSHDVLKLPPGTIYFVYDLSATISCRTNRPKLYFDRLLLILNILHLSFSLTSVFLLINPPQSSSLLIHIAQIFGDGLGSYMTVFTAPYVANSLPSSLRDPLGTKTPCITLHVHKASRLYSYLVSFSTSKKQTSDQ